MSKLTINKEVIARLGNQSVIDNHGLARVAGAGCDTISVHPTCPESSHLTQPVVGTCTCVPTEKTCGEQSCFGCGGGSDDSLYELCFSVNNYNCLSIIAKGTEPCA